MKRTFKFLTTFAFSIAVGASSAQPNNRSLRSVVGSKLSKLIVGSTMEYGDPPVSEGVLAVFRQDYHFKFYEPENLGAQGPYRVLSDKVCVDAGNPWCFAVFSDSRGHSYIRVDGDPVGTYQAVTFRQLEPGEVL